MTGGRTVLQQHPPANRYTVLGKENEKLAIEPVSLHTHVDKILEIKKQAGEICSRDLTKSKRMRYSVLLEKPKPDLALIRAAEITTDEVQGSDR